VKYEADRQQDHDDLLFALGLCVWWGEVMGDSNWSHNVDVTPATDGRLIRRRPQMVKQRRIFLEDVPEEQPFDEQAFDQMKEQWGSGDTDGLGPLRPERP
jgi:hypothetical protein